MLSNKINLIVCPNARTIYDHLNLIRDVIHLCNVNNLPLGVVNLHQRNTFDNVDHDYLFNVMRAMGFGDKFISYLHLLYSSAESHIKVCGSLTAPFPFVKGIRQGCPLSGLLYTVAIEPFLNTIRKDLQGQGFSLPNTQNYCSVSAYADDITIFITSDLEFETIQRVYSLFSESSAARLNYEKSKGL